MMAGRWFPRVAREDLQATKVKRKGID